MRPSGPKSGSKDRSDFSWQARVVIGYSHDAENPFFRGVIDEIGIFDRALTGDEIAALANPRDADSRRVAEKSIPER